MKKIYKNVRLSEWFKEFGLSPNMFACASSNLAPDIASFLISMILKNSKIIEKHFCKLKLLFSP
jgi:hypothetical protein